MPVPNTPRRRQYANSASPQPAPAASGSPGSLLNRLALSPSSLLTRLNVSPPTGPYKRVPLAERLSTQAQSEEYEEGAFRLAAERQAGMSESMTESGQVIEQPSSSPPSQSSNLPLSLRLQPSPGMGAVTIDDMVTTPPGESQSTSAGGVLNEALQVPLAVEPVSGDPPECPSSPTSELAVDTLLAPAPDASEDRTTVTPSGSSEPADFPPLAPASPSSIIEECRRLLLPQLMRNVRMRGPDMGVDEEALRRRAGELLTEERCREFVALAHEVRAQMQQREKGKGRVRAEGQAEECRSPAKRLRDASDLQEEEGARGGKVPRISAPRAEEPGGGGKAAAHHLDGGHDESTIPEAPKMMRTDPAMHAVKEYLARASIPPTDTDPHPSSSSVPPTLPLVATSPMAPSTPVDVPPQDKGTTMYADTDGDNTAEQSTPENPHRHSIHDDSPQMDVDNIPLEGQAPQPIRNSRFALPTDSSLAQNDFSLTMQIDPPLPDSQDLAARPPSPTRFQLSSVPGLWSVNVGMKGPHVLDFEFFVDQAVADAAQRWVRRRQQFDVNDAHVTAHLLCLPAQTVADVHQQLDPTATPQDLAHTLWNIPTSWPPAGKLIVQINADAPGGGHTWFPVDLGPSNGPLDMTACVRGGKNTVRLVQLCDMSDCVFVVHAALPSPEEREQLATEALEQRDWAAFFVRVSTKLPRAGGSPSASSPAIGISAQ